MNLKAKVVSDFSRHDVKSRTRIEVLEQPLRVAFAATLLGGLAD